MVGSLFEKVGISGECKTEEGVNTKSGESMAENSSSSSSS